MQPRRGVAFTTVTVVLFAPGVGTCRGERQRADRSSPPHNAGIPILEVLGPAAPDSEAWAISRADPALIPEEGTATSAALLDGGRVAVLDGPERKLKLYTHAGRAIALYGREGYGPGEFMDPAAVVKYRGDSLAVLDVRLRRFLLFSSERGFARQIPVTVPGQRLELVGILEDGAFVLRVWNFEPPREGSSWRQPATFVRVDAAGAGIDTLFTVPGQQFYQVSFAGTPVFGLRPFGMRSVAAAARGVVAVNDGAGCDLALRDESGAMQATLRPQCSSRSITGSAKSAWAAAHTARIFDVRGALGRFWTSYYRSNRVPYPRTSPPYDRLLFDDCGVLWVGTYSLPTDTLKLWSLLSPGGSRLATLTTPYPMDLQQIAADRVVAIRTDSLGRGRVSTYRLTRPAPWTLHQACSSD